MPPTNQKTTVYLDIVEYGRLKGLAERRGCPPAMLVREAVAEYVTKHSPTTWPKSIASSGKGPADLAANADEYLAGMGDVDPTHETKRPSTARRQAPGRPRRTR